MSDSSTVPVSTVISDSRLVGRVKWFNNKSGFGFITLCDGTDKDKDIFVHYTCLSAENSPYKYLVQGEYVEFDLIKSEDENHEFHAANVTGIKGGLLMCQTNSLNNTVIRTYVPRHNRPYEDDRNGPPRRRQQVRDSVDGSAGVDGDSTKVEGFTEVKRKGAPRKRAA
jgi:cold shock CspA family protein